MIVSCDLDLDPMTLIYEYDLNVVEIYRYIPKINSLVNAFGKLEHHRQTDRKMRPNALLSSNTKDHLS